MNTVLNKTSYQEFKKPLILGSGLCFLPSVIFLGCLFCFLSLSGPSLDITGGVCAAVSKFRQRRVCSSRKDSTALLWRQKCKAVSLTL